MAKLTPCFVTGCQRQWRAHRNGEVQAVGGEPAKRCSVCGLRIRKEPETHPKLLKKA